MWQLFKEVSFQWLFVVVIYRGMDCMGLQLNHIEKYMDF
jgi:hypothetical protein